ncbi:MAG: Uma2 family endonuclease [Candidatus Methylumidiphilus sp.]
MAIPRPKTSAADYLDFERAAAERHQFVDGEIFAMAGESLAHSTINANLLIALGSRLRGQPCRVLSPNMKIRSGPADVRSSKGLYSYADVSVVCGVPRFHDGHQDVLLNPSLIAEVLSPSTEAFDRGDKFLRYRAHIDSFTDYLLVSTAAPRVEHFTREAANRWVYTCLEGLQECLLLPNIGIQLDMAELFECVEFTA